MPGIELERAPVRALGRAQLAEIDEQRAEIHVLVRARRPELRGPLEVRARLAQPLGFAQREPEVRVRGGEVGLDRDRALEAGERRGGVAQALAQDAEVVPALRVVRVDREPFLEALPGVLEVAPAQVDHALLDERLGIVGPELEDAAQLQRRLVQVAGLVVAEGETHARVAGQGVRPERAKVVVDCAGMVAAREQEIADASRSAREPGVGRAAARPAGAGFVAVAAVERGVQCGRRTIRRPLRAPPVRPGELVPQLLQHRRRRSWTVGTAGARDRPQGATGPRLAGSAQAAVLLPVRLSACSIAARSARHSGANSQSRYSSKYGPPSVKCTSDAFRSGAE